MAQIIWSPRAIEDLQSIHGFISTDSILYADKMINRILLKTEILKSQMLIGRIVPEFDKPYIRELLESSYRIVYVVEDDSNISIVHIQHQSRLLTAL